MPSVTDLHLLATRPRHETMANGKRKWTLDEDRALLQGVEAELARPTGRGNSINWNEIAKRVPLRNNKDCRKRYLNGMAWNLKKGPWSSEEDSQLKELIRRYGTSWVDVSRAMGTRSADQCSKRWYHCLNPELDRQPWKKDENQLLLKAHATHGSSWKLIQERYLPSRSANNIRNQYTILTRTSSRSDRQATARLSDTESLRSSDHHRTTPRVDPHMVYYDESDESMFEAPIPPPSFDMRGSHDDSRGAFNNTTTTRSNNNDTILHPTGFGNDMFQGLADTPSTAAPPLDYPITTSSSSSPSPSIFPVSVGMDQDSFGWFSDDPMAGGDEYRPVPHHRHYHPAATSVTTSAAAAAAALPGSSNYPTYIQQPPPPVAQPRAQLGVSAPMSWAAPYDSTGLFVPPGQRPDVRWSGPSAGSSYPVAPLMPFGADFPSPMDFLVDESSFGRC